MSHEAQIAILGALLTAAAVYDVTLRKIPNWITSSVAVSGIVAQWASSGVIEAGKSALAALVVGAVLVPFWRARVLGGGDLKLGAAAAVWVGLAQTPRFMIASLLAGGVLALACYAMSGRAARATVRANLSTLNVPDLPTVRATPGAVVVPYGAAFAAGALWIVMW